MWTISLIVVVVCEDAPQNLSSATAVCVTEFADTHELQLSHDWSEFEWHISCTITQVCCHSHRFCNTLQNNIPGYNTIHISMFRVTCISKERHLYLCRQQLDIYHKSTWIMMIICCIFHYCIFRYLIHVLKKYIWGICYTISV